MKQASLISILMPLACLGGAGIAQQVTGQDLDTILERADKLFEQAKSAYEEALSKASVPTFIDAGFKLEESRIKYLVLQEIGSTEKQKLAADRLRAVNQLNKLIHDGKAAINGRASDSSVVKPSDASPPPPSKEPANPATPAAAPAVDVSKRAQIPDAAKLREAEKLIKDLFKEQYSKKTPADRKVLVRVLMEQAAKSRDDLAALWVLCREAQDNAAQICDAPAALESIEMAARVFDVDAMAMKNAVLVAAGKTARTPEDLVVLAGALDRLIDEFIRADQYDSADKAATLAVQYARKSNDAITAARASTRSREVTEAKTLYQSMNRVMQTQAKNSDDSAANLEIGRFLCFVKGNWDLGLRFIVKGSDKSLKALAEKELAFPQPAADLAALGDGWYDLSEKEKSPLRKSRLTAHARAIYESALPDSTALLRARIEKRLAEMDGAAAAAEKRFQVDLLKLINPERDTTTNTKWRFDAGVLVSTRGGGVDSATVTIPYMPPDEYDLSITVERKEPGDFFKFGVVSGRNMVSYVIDSRNNSAVMGYAEGGYSGELLPLNKSVTIVSAVRRNSFKVVVDGKTVVDLKSGLDHPSNEPGYPSGLYLKACNSLFHVTKMTVTPVSGGQGKRLR